MSVRILIRRRVPESTARKMLPLFKKMRQMATVQAGYISGETLRNCNDPEEFLVISTWQSIADWDKWLDSPDRQKTQKKIDDLLGGNTHYEAFYYGFTE